MAAYRYRIVNVFTQNQRAFTGNPLCVFESADSLDAATMQALALQFNNLRAAAERPSQYG